MPTVLVYFYSSICDISDTFLRCTANRNNLDGGSGRHCREHTELIVSEFELGVLWDEYGLVGDVVVRLNPGLISQY